MQIRKTFVPFGAVCLSVVALAGCSGSQNAEPEITEPPQLNAPQAFAGNLVQSGNAKASTYIKNGLYVASLLKDSPVSDAAPPANGSESLSFSTTNTQEQGVDEADRIEFVECWIRRRRLKTNMRIARPRQRARIAWSLCVWGKIHQFQISVWQFDQRDINRLGRRAQ